MFVPVLIYKGVPISVIRALKSSLLFELPCKNKKMPLKRMRELLDRNLALLLKNTLLNKQNLLTRFHLCPLGPTMIRGNIEKNEAKTNMQEKWSICQL